MIIDKVRELLSIQISIESGFNLNIAELIKADIFRAYAVVLVSFYVR